MRKVPEVTISVGDVTYFARFDDHQPNTPWFGGRNGERIWRGYFLIDVLTYISRDITKRFNLYDREGGSYVAFSEARDTVS